MNRDVLVREVMVREFVGVSESDGVLETTELLLREEAELAVVLRGSDLVGVLTERDVLAHVVEGGDPGDTTVEDVMTESVPTVSAEETLPEARDRMSSWSTSWLVVSDGGKPPDGIVTEHDILATSTLGSETAATERQTPEEQHQQMTAVSTTATESSSAAEDSFDDQGICEMCGSLTRDLASFNGQLLCVDCRNI